MQEEYVLMDNTLENAIMVEQMRYKAYGVTFFLNVDESEYVPEILNSNILVFLFKLDNKPVAACYISIFHNSLFVDYLFVLPEYQRKGFHYGQKLLAFIIEHKEIVEKHFNKNITTSELCPGSNYVVPIYESLGYKKKSINSAVMHRKI